MKGSANFIWWTVIVWSVVYISIYGSIRRCVVRYLVTYMGKKLWLYQTTRRRLLVIYRDVCSCLWRCVASHLVICIRGYIWQHVIGRFGIYIRGYIWQHVTGRLVYIFEVILDRMSPVVFTHTFEFIFDNMSPLVADIFKVVFDSMS